MRILIVEDDEAIMQAAQALPLLFPDDEFVFAIDYNTAVQSLQNGSFDIILSDFQYAGRGEKNPNPKGNGGTDLLEYVTQEKIPALFALASARSIDEVYGALTHRGLTLPKDLFFEKPLALMYAIETLKAKAAPAEPGPLAIKPNGPEDNLG